MNYKPQLNKHCGAEISMNRFSLVTATRVASTRGRETLWARTSTLALCTVPAQVRQGERARTCQRGEDDLRTRNLRVCDKGCGERSQHWIFIWGHLLHQVMGKETKRKAGMWKANTSAPMVPSHCCTHTHSQRHTYTNHKHILAQSRRHVVSPYLTPPFASCFISWWVIALGLLNWDNPHSHTHARTHRELIQ